ncbi:MAG: DsbA family protein [Parvibaculales bacterium]
MRKFVSAALLAALIFTTGVIDSAWSQKLDNASKDEIRQLIADYLMENPEALAEALDNMQNHFRRQQELSQKKLLQENADEIFFNTADFSLGPKNAPITIVEFFDYNCGYCKRSFQPLMDVASANKDVRVVFKEFPILNKNSERAARAALAFDDQLQYIAFHTKLMTARASLSPAVIDKALSDAGVDIDAHKKREGAANIDKHLQDTARLARSLNISGTPAFIVNNSLYPGALDKDGLQAAVETARAALK